MDEQFLYFGLFMLHVAAWVWAYRLGLMRGRKETKEILKSHTATLNQMWEEAFRRNYNMPSK